LAIHPEHFSAYILSYEPGTRLYARLISGKITEADDDLISEMYEYLCQAAKAAGYEHYEISNFALPGHRAVHNANYWKFKPYVGLGPSAHSFDGNVRRINPSNTKTYLHAIQSHHIAAEIEEENSTDTLNDKIMVALRTAEGLDLNSLTSEQRQAIMQRAKHVPADHIHQHDTRIFIPEHRFLVSDAIIRTLME
jgi:oxygen-independent coproporphyrinogen-3 oxidase